ncbi:MAG: hypothetical protein QM601_08630 [Pseudoxanthomonas sp.]
MTAGGLLLLAAPGLAQAYLGPGLGLGAIGAALGAVAAVFLGLLSIVWYPFKRLWRRLRGKAGNRKAGAAERSSQSASSEPESNA